MFTATALKCSEIPINFDSDIHSSLHYIFRNLHLFIQNVPTNILNTLLLAYSSISLNQSGRQSNVGWQDMSYTNINACADL